MNTITKKIIIAVLILTLCLGTTVTESYAESTYQDVGLITLVSSSTTSGSISFYINVPAAKTVAYEVYADIQYSSGNVDRTAGTITNNGTTVLKKLVTVPVKFLGKYKIKANHTYNYIWDTETVLSKFSGTKYSTPFKWTQAQINAYNLNNQITFGVMLTTSIVVDIFATKGIATGFTLLATGADIYGVMSPDTASEENIREVPILNYSWKIKSVAGTNSYTNYLLVYNTNNVLLNTYYLDSVSFSEFSF